MISETYICYKNDGRKFVSCYEPTDRTWSTLGHYCWSQVNVMTSWSFLTVYYFSLPILTSSYFSLSCKSCFGTLGRKLWAFVSSEFKRLKLLKSDFLCLLKFWVWEWNSVDSISPKLWNLVYESCWFYTRSCLRILNLSWIFMKF